MRYILGLFMFFSVSLCTKAESVHLEAEVVDDEYELRNMQAIHAVKFKAEFSSGKKLSDIVLRHHTLLSQWRLSLARNVFSSGVHDDKQTLTIDEYESLVSSILEYVSTEGLGLDSINTTYGFVDTTWEVIINALKELAKTRKGKMNLELEPEPNKIRDRIPASNAITAALQNSDITDKTCSLVNKYLGKDSYYTCEIMASAEVLVFQSEYWNKSWEDVAESEDGGLNKTSWFLIEIKR